MKIKVKDLKAALTKAIEKQENHSSFSTGLISFDDSLVDFSDEMELDLADVLAQIADDVTELG